MPPSFTPAGKNDAPEVRFAHSPDWFRRCPALYIPTAESAGAVMLTFAGQGTATPPGLASELARRIDSFRKLPDILEQARAVGTNVIYLVDYYQGREGQPPRDFWRNKGDYAPRSDLGGEQALKEGVAAVHAKGGRVILYVEGFIISKLSQAGKAHGLEWTIMTPQGPLQEPWPDYWHLCPACPGWTDHLTSVSRRLVGEYGADGIFIDSFGFQKGLRCVNAKHGHEPNKPAVFDRGCAALVRRIREAIQQENPEAVALVEGPTASFLFPTIDGCQDWSIRALKRRPLLWNAAGRTDVFTAGWSLDDLHQILALGHKLSLGGYWFESPSGTSCEDAVTSAQPKPIPPFKLPRGRRYYAEKSFRTLHQWRNAGLLLGLAMPAVDDVTPRRWDREDLFASERTLEDLLNQVRSRARDIDAVLAPRERKPLPAPAEHIRRLVEARARLSPYIDDGARVVPLETNVLAAEAYCFVSSVGTALSVVNTGDAPAEVLLRLPESAARVRLKDEVSGETVSATERGLKLVCPPHALRMFAEVP